jgi:hypothetical protein
MALPFRALILLLCSLVLIRETLGIGQPPLLRFASRPAESVKTPLAIPVLCRSNGWTVTFGHGDDIFNLFCPVHEA